MSKDNNFENEHQYHDITCKVKVDVPPFDTTYDL